MFEDFNEIMDETMEELQENGTMEQDNAFENGNAEVSPEEAEAVGRGEYSPEASAHAWNEYNRLSGKDREAFLRGHSRNAHIINVEMRNERSGSTTGERETAEEKESVGYSSDYYKHELATARNDIQRDYALKNYRAALARETVGSTTGEGEAAETAEEQESVGYSSDYYEHQMASALKNGNKIAYDNARSNWAKAKVKESVGSTTGAGEVDEVSEDKEAAGYSSDYYKHELATARNDVQRDYALKNYRAALARETVGSTTGEGEAAETAEEQESVGYSSDYYEHQMASALKNGNKIAYDNARSNWAKAKVRESVGYKAEDGSIIEGPDPNKRHGREK